LVIYVVVFPRPNPIIEIIFYQMSSRVMTKLLTMMRTSTTVSKYLFSISLKQRGRGQCRGTMLWFRKNVENSTFDSKYIRLFAPKMIRTLVFKTNANWCQNIVKNRDSYDCWRAAVAAQQTSEEKIEKLDLIYIQRHHCNKLQQNSSTLM
jgi:hypothetical protein